MSMFIFFFALYIFLYFLFRKVKAISFNFFIHGESTVCSSIDIRLMPPIYFLNKCHISAAQSGHQGIKGKVLNFILIKYL